MAGALGTAREKSGVSFSDKVDKNLRFSGEAELDGLAQYWSHVLRRQRPDVCVRVRVRVVTVRKGVGGGVHKCRPWW